MASSSKAACGPRITLTLSRSMTSWALVRAPAGLPPVSATSSSTLRPASVLAFSLRKARIPCSIWMPPWASGPVFTVSRPILNGAACAMAGVGNRSVAAAVPATVPARNVLRSSLRAIEILPGFAFCWSNRSSFRSVVALGPLFELVAEFLVREHPAKAARHVVQTQHVQVLAVHGGDAVREHEHAVIAVEGREGGVEHARIGVDAHQRHRLRAQPLQELIEVGAVEAVQALLVVDHVIALGVERRDDLGARRADDVVVVDRAVAPRG